jgi:hypothetical protein
MKIDRPSRNAFYVKLAELAVRDIQSDIETFGPSKEYSLKLEKAQALLQEMKNRT